jgi:hypothetical protein
MVRWSPLSRLFESALIVNWDKERKKPRAVEGNHVHKTALFSVFVRQTHSWGHVWVGP